MNSSPEDFRKMALACKFSDGENLDELACRIHHLFNKDKMPTTYGNLDILECLERFPNDVWGIIRFWDIPAYTKSLDASIRLYPTLPSKIHSTPLDICANALFDHALNCYADLSDSHSEIDSLRKENHELKKRISQIEEYWTGLFHPEFGTEWDKDGLIGQAIHSAKESVLDSFKVAIHRAKLSLKKDEYEFYYQGNFTEGHRLDDVLKGILVVEEILENYEKGQNNDN
jgi:hypothetical protein